VRAADRRLKALAPSPKTHQTQLLLLADPLQQQGIAAMLQADPSLGQVVFRPEDLDGAPQLVIWSLAAPPPAASLELELQRLSERWQPAPILLVLPGGHGYSALPLLQLPVQGLLEAPTASPLREAVATLLSGGRMLEIAPTNASAGNNAGPIPAPTAMGLGQWLLTTGLWQIEAELRLCSQYLDQPSSSLLGLLLLQGRMRELRAARQLLLWLWGPLSLAWSGSLADSCAAPGVLPQRGFSGQNSGVPGLIPVFAEREGIAITLRQCSADGLWETLRERLRQESAAGPANASGGLLALDGLLDQRRSDLLLSLLEQFDQLRSQLQGQSFTAERLLEQWNDLQPMLRQQALRRMAGAYVQLPRQGVMLPVAETLVDGSSLSGEDPDLPDPLTMLSSLVQARPLLVEGRLLPPDEPQALIYLEMLLANWLVRSAEQISAEVLAACADWPELRRYLLRPELLATRNLERLRNQLNAQQRWQSWVERPVQLYESRRPLYCLQGGSIRTEQLTEPRDQELKRLGWLQQWVTLSLETRDALAPQVQSLMRGLGDLLVVVLTKVVGRAIGLVGRGIAQGMGRSFGRGS
jgi:hypothetical protein